MSGMKTRLLFAACAATVSLAACGGGEEPASSSGTPTKEAQNRKAMLDFAQCMRENGIDMPDPQFEGGRVTMKMGGKPGEIDPAKMQAADKACAKHPRGDEAAGDVRGGVGGVQEAGAGPLPLHARARRRHARTRRSTRTAARRCGSAKGLNPESAKFKKAEKACRDKSPMGPAAARPTTRAGMMRLAPLLAGGVAVAAVAAGGAIVAGGGEAPVRAAGRPPRATATVERLDLVDRES